MTNPAARPDLYTATSFAGPAPYSVQAELHEMTVAAQQATWPARAERAPRTPAGGRPRRAPRTPFGVLLHR
jgi:hypothetical protein